MSTKKTTLPYPSAPFSSTATGTATATANGTTAVAAQPVEHGQRPGPLQQVQSLLESGQPQQALDRINAARAANDPALKNARGVCLLRLGEPDRALQLYRGLVLQPQGILLRSDVPIVWKSNLATSLLLCGNVSGCVSLLNELRDEQHPALDQLRQAISSWQAGLSLWQKLGWKLGLAPACPVPLNFPPGGLN